MRLPRPSDSEVLQATGATRSRAYELRDALLERLPELDRPVGRPRIEKPAPVDTGAITREVLDFVVEHPGRIYRRAERRCYSDSFRRFVLELCERARQFPLADFAFGTQVPLGTIKDWLRGGNSSADHPAEADSTFAPKEGATGSRLEEGDGTPIAVEINGQRFDFNLELMVDAHSDASVGISIRDEEDSQAVIDAFEDGVETAGAPPLAVLLDNRPSTRLRRCFPRNRQAGVSLACQTPATPLRISAILDW